VTNRFARIKFEKLNITIMAQLITTKEKYGVSVAARIDPQLAHQIAAKAENLGVSMAKMLSMIISQGMSAKPTNDEYLLEQVEELRDEVDQAQEVRDALQQLYKDAAARTIEAIASDDEQMVAFATRYNEILEELKNEREYSE
jgi:antitoxin component of RelBE/YafQ-DinJ toxin-antitoxin module